MPSALGVKADLAAPRPGATPAEERLLAAVGAVVARFGAIRSTLDDFARQAACSRATAYRCFPGGKDALLAAYVRSESDRLRAEVRSVVAASTSLTDAVAAALHAVGRWAATNQALVTVLAHEPELVSRHVGFRSFDPLLAAVAAEALLVVSPYVDAHRAPVAADLLARLVASHVCAPSPHFDLADPASTRRYAEWFCVPLVLGAAPAAGA